MKKNILYLGFVGFQNLGDEVCYDAFNQRLALMPGYAAVPYDLREKPSVAEIQRRSPLRGVVLGGGSLLQGTAFIEPAFEAAAMGLPMWTFGTGVDYFTEDYAKDPAPQPSVDAPQMFEDKELQIDKIKTIIRHCRFAGVRGPLTYQFLSSVADKDNVHIIGDPGLVYMPEKDATLLGERPGNKFVAVNWGSSFGSIFGHDEARTMAALADGLCHLIDDLGYGILIYPMWEGDTAPCARLFEAVDRKGRCTLAPGVSTVNGVCRMLREAAFSIGLKLHANILSARMGTPFIALAYRSKCYDFACSIGMGGQCISTSSGDIADFIAGQERLIVRERTNMQRSMAHYREIYRGQYEQLWQSLIKTI
jgi:hypothetical protein